MNIKLQSESLSFSKSKDHLGKSGSEEDSLKDLDLTVVIPIRVTCRRNDLLERIHNYSADTDIPDNISVIVVDDGSEPKYFDELKEVIDQTDITLIRTGSDHHQPFNIALARNLGVQHARSELVIFMDADLLPYPGFFNDVLLEADLLGLKEKATGFLMCPVIYLTSLGYKEYCSLSSERRLPFCINALLRADWSIVDKYSSGTSAIVVRKDYFLTRGGNDTRFSGWGFEDYEFSNRLIRRFRQFSMPRDWLYMGGNFMNVKDFRGWKSVYRLHGDWLAQKGIWLVHAPHVTVESDQLKSSENWDLLEKRMKIDASGMDEIASLSDLTVGRSLFLAKNPFCYDRIVAPFFGDPVFELEKKFESEIEIESFIQKHSIERVIFGNPYANASATFVYRWCRTRSFPFYVCERGALPDSVTYDSTGFLDDGTSYKACHWDFELSRERIAKTEEYIDNLRFGNHMLEIQSERISIDEVRRRLGIENSKKVLLVPFQQPNDSVVREFSGAIENFEKFHELVCNLPEKLGEDWVVVYKKHPVEDRVPPVNGAICADDFNVYDLIEISDALLVINSSVGLLGMMFGKPVYIVGESWYADKLMNVKLTNIDAVHSKIQAGFEPDYDRIVRFVHYLRFEFYSFGRQVQRRVRYPDGSPITSTGKIDFYELRGICRRPLFYGKFDGHIRSESPLFDRYRSQNPLQPLSSSASRGVVRRKLIRKLKANPGAFFRDSKFPFLRPLRFLLSRLDGRM